MLCSIDWILRCVRGVTIGEILEEYSKRIIQELLIVEYLQIIYASSADFAAERQKREP